MSLLGALNNSALAMQAQSISMGQISTNIANVRTTGYKGDIVNFKTLLSGTSSSTFNSFSARAVSDRNVEMQGAIYQTGNPLDVAVNGSGMFMVGDRMDGTGGTFYTRDGAFKKQVVTQGTAQTAWLSTGQGAYVLGWPATTTGGVTSFNSTAAPQPIQFNPNDHIDGKATTSMVLRGNISAEKNLVSTDLSVNGSPVTNADGTQSWPTRGVRLVYTRDQAVDAPPNSWFVTLQNSDGTPAGTVATGNANGTVQFNSKGEIISPANGSLTLTLDATATQAAQTIQTDVSQVTQYGQNNSLFGSTVTLISQDGYEDGFLEGTEIDANGVLNGVYSNHKTLPLYKLAMARFPAPQLLTMLSENLYAETPDAGTRVLVELGTTSAGQTALDVTCLESSTVDMAEEFSRMIMTQTAYTQAATAFRTSDEMYQVASGLKR